MTGTMRRLVGGALVLGLSVTAAACGDDASDDGGEESTDEGEESDDLEGPEFSVTTCRDYGEESGDAADGGEAEGGTDDGGDAADRELEEVSVAIFPAAGFAPLFNGVDAGYFEEEGIDLNVEIAGVAGAALVQAVIQGEYDISISNYVSLFSAHNEGLPVQVLADGASGHDVPEGGTQGLMVASDSDIESIEDLEGASFGVTALDNIGEVTVRAMFQKHGLDDSGIEFLEFAPGDMNLALERGEIDVAWQVEPGLTMGEQEGMTVIADPMYETAPNLPLAGMYSSQSWIEDNPELAEGFHRAWQRSCEDASDDETMRAKVAEHLEMDPSLVEEIRLDDYWTTEVNVDGLTYLADLSTEYEIMDEEPNLDELVWTPPED